MRRPAITIGTLLAAIVIVWALGSLRVAKAPGSGGACTMEAKICPDGSAVGRTGPNCEFAACPPAPVSNTSGTTTLAIGASATIQSITMSVLGLAEDSRCPVDVQCIQAGTVRVRTSVNTTPITFTLGQPQVASNATITLVSVIPAQKHSAQTIEPSDYRFTFTIVPKVTTTTSTSGVRGTVLLGPTCPVERIPPDPECADKGYATTITVHRSDSSSVVATGKSDESGAFQFSLPPGFYTLIAAGGTTLPRCNETSVTVLSNAYTTTTISCDTGIR